MLKVSSEYFFFFFGNKIILEPKLYIIQVKKHKAQLYRNSNFENFGNNEIELFIIFFNSDEKIILSGPEWNAAIAENYSLSIWNILFNCWII